MTRFECQNIYEIAGSNRADFFRALDRVGLTRVTELLATLNPGRNRGNQEDVERVKCRLENLKYIAQLISAAN